MTGVSGHRLLVVLVVVAAACSETTGGTSVPVLEQGTIQVQATSITFSSVEAMADASDMIALGTVTDVGEGDFEPAPETEDFRGTQMLRVTLRIDETLKGEQSVGETVAFRWYGYDVELDGSKGPQWIVEDQPPPVVGDQGVWFFTHADSGTDLALTAFEGRLILDTDDRLQLVRPVESGAADEIAGLSLPELRALIGTATD